MGLLCLLQKLLVPFVMFTDKMWRCSWSEESVSFCRRCVFVRQSLTRSVCWRSLQTNWIWICISKTRATVLFQNMVGFSLHVGDSWSESRFMAVVPDRRVKRESSRKPRLLTPSAFRPSERVFSGRWLSSGLTDQVRASEIQKEPRVETPLLNGLRYTC